MTPLQQIARQAAEAEALRYSTDPILFGEVERRIADAVALAVVNAFTKYRPQHDEDCQSSQCVVCEGTEIYHGEWLVHDHPFQPKPCSCGLSALLSVPPSSGEARREKNDHGAGLIHQTIPDVAETEPRPSFCPTCGTALGEDQ